MEDVSLDQLVLRHNSLILLFAKIAQLCILLETALLVVDLDVQAAQQQEILFLTSVLQIGFAGLHALWEQERLQIITVLSALGLQLTVIVEQSL